MAVDSLDVNEFGSHAQRGVARSQRAGEDGHKARTRWLVHELYEQRTVLHVARAKGRDSQEWDRDSGHDGGQDGHRGVLHHQVQGYRHVQLLAICYGDGSCLFG